MKRCLALVLAVLMLLSVFSIGVAEEATGADVKGTGVQLTVYTNSGSSGRKEWLIERAAQDGFNLAVLEEGAGAVQQRIIGEAANPIADVVFGLNAIIWNDLISRDLLVAYDAPSWASEVSEGLNDPNGYYYAIVKQAIVLAYDLNQISEEDAPKDWPDLWTNEAFHGKYEVNTSLTGGTPRNVIAGILTRYIDPEGELGISDEGWEAIGAYYACGVPSEEGVDLYAQIANPNTTVVMGQMWSSGVVQYDEMYGTKTGVAKPEVGVPYAVEGIGIINGTKNMDEALRFVEWFGSAQIQGEWAEQFGTMPANEIAAEKADAVQQELCSIPAQDIDWALVAENIDAWCEKIALEYLP
ncbi:MAG TPA: extracellular solute-binding protein [Candidatus Onthenecus intestinigallinarum]|uniref:Extracellular solute-binding protein n=1 Tax=Candidatus Onthenecus intestinigallinarum TaxID=2840875 RepID=A0A9D0ZA74_9FIRM|nr:extracellular solute-binding protein [Candidatus Onthenecus intestinigallinarum]